MLKVALQFILCASILAQQSTAGAAASATEDKDLPTKQEVEALRAKVKEDRAKGDTTALRKDRKALIFARKQRYEAKQEANDNSRTEKKDAPAAESKH